MRGEERPSTNGLLRTAATFVSGNLVVTALGLAGALIQARLIVPGTLGEFKQYTILASYTVFLSAGTFDIMAREYPYLIGRGESARARDFASACQAWGVVAAAACASIFAALGLVAAVRGNAHGAAGWLTQGLVAATALYGGYLNTTFRSAHEFSIVTRASVIGAFIGTALLALLIWWPFYGLCVRALLPQLAIAAVLFAYRPVRAGLAFRWGTIFGAIKRGVPLAAAGYIDNAFARGLESTLVLTFCGPYDLGLFALVQAALAAFIVIPGAVGSVLLPRLAHLYGQTHDLGRVARASLKPTLLLTLAAAALTAMSWLLVEPLIALLLPKYVNAVPAVKAVTLVGPVWSLRVPGLALYAAGKARAYAAVTISGLLGFGVWAAWAIAAGFGLTGIVQAIVAGGLVRAVATAAVLGLAVRGAEWRDG